MQDFLLLKTNKWHQFWQLRLKDKLFLAYIVLLLVFAAVCRRIFSLRQLQRIMSFLFPLAHQPRYLYGNNSLNAVERTTRLLQIAATHGLFKANCLEQSLILWGLLRKQGIHPKIVIGACLVDGQLQSHAWLEYEDQVINEQEDVASHYPMIINSF